MLTQSDHLRHADIGHDTTAVLNLRTGTWVWLDRDARQIWAAALAGPIALSTLQDAFVFRGHDAHQVHDAIEQTVASLLDNDLLAPLSAPRRRAGWRRVIPCR